MNPDNLTFDIFDISTFVDFQNILEYIPVNRNCIKSRTLLRVTLCYIGKLFPTVKLISQCCNPRDAKRKVAYYR